MYKIEYGYRYEINPVLNSGRKFWEVKKQTIKKGFDPFVGAVFYNFSKIIDYCESKEEAEKLVEELRAKT